MALGITSLFASYQFRCYPAIVENDAEFALYHSGSGSMAKKGSKSYGMGESADTTCCAIAQCVAYSISEECSPAQQPEGVENNENGRPGIGHDREPETRVAEQGEDEKDSLYPDGESDVKSNYT